MSARLPVSRRALVVLPAAGLLLAGIVAALPSSAAAAYTETGTATAPAVVSPTGFGVTDVGFLAGGCPNGPGDTQGVDGWVFLPPADVMAPGGQVTIVASSGGAPTDVGVYVYDADCGYLRTESGDGTLTFPIKAGDRFLSAYSFTGVETTFALAIERGVVTEPTETASPSVSPSASPTATSGGGATGLRTRHAYPAPPNDPLYAEKPLLGIPETSVGVGQWGMQKIRAAEAWQRPRATGAGVQVAVLDTGLDLGHPDLSCEGKVRELPAAAPAGMRPQDVDGHGTHVAGIIGACTNNGTGVVGVAPDATLLPFRVIAAEAEAVDLAKAIRDATDAGAHVINMSLGFGVGDPVGLGVTVPGSGSAFGLIGLIPDIEAAVGYATSQGVVVVAASGNESFPLCGYPALVDKVVCVGATDRRDLPAWYSNPPVKADGGFPTDGPAIVAPGGSLQPTFCDLNSEDILSTYAREFDRCEEAAPGYEGIDGTSMASPHVAGVAALVYDRLGAARSAANADKVVQALLDGAVDLGAPGYDPVFGAGRLDAVAAVEAVDPVVDPDPTGSPSTSPSASPSSSPSPTAAPPADSALELTAPASGQRTDSVDVSAVLTSGGAPVAGQPVRLAVTGGPSTDTVTDSSGAVRWTLPLGLEPGTYELTATYAGSPTVAPSGDHQPLQVLREDTATTLTSAAGNPTPTLTARVADSDTRDAGVAGVPVAFLVDGTEVGRATTDDSGTATYTPAKKAKRTYEARFEGDSRWSGSGAALGR